MNAPRVPRPGVYERLGHMALAATIGVSTAGFLIGVRNRPEQQPAVVPAEDESSATDSNAPPQVVDYLQMTQVRRGPNASWKQSLPKYHDDPTQFFGGQSATDAQRQVAVELRNARRAFSGAPPVVPHAIDERNAQACLACHGAGLKVGQVIAPRMSHHYLPNCTQCHVEAGQNALWALAAATPSSDFVGLPEPGRGERAGPGAPPTIPHAVWMRSNCSTCHGTLGKEGLRTSHPWRASCTQCHAPSRGFDWSPLDVPPTPSAPGEPAAGRLAGARVQ